MRHKYFMTMSMYPEGEGENVPMKVGIDTPTPYANLNTERWQQVKTFNTHEEFEKWKNNHPWSWNVINIDKIEEIK